MSTVHVLFPFDGTVTDGEVISYAKDSYFNHADFYDCAVCRKRYKRDNVGCVHELTPVYRLESKAPETLEEAKDWLENTGEVTFRRD